jgi:TnpA family transposase
VETNAVCIYAQARSFSHSEVAAIVEGLIRHDTEMRVEKNFVDSHGQSEVAFAICHLLGLVKLMPRLKRIKYERRLFRNVPERRGLWADAKPEPPWDWRRTAAEGRRR